MREWLQAVPSELPIGLEVPQLAKASSGVPLRDYLGEALSRTLLLPEQPA